MEPKIKKETAKFCGNILVRKTKRRSFLAKSLFEGVFGVLTDVTFEYYHSSAQWVSFDNLRESSWLHSPFCITDCGVSA